MNIFQKAKDDKEREKVNKDTIILNKQEKEEEKKEIAIPTSVLNESSALKTTAPNPFLNPDSVGNKSLVSFGSSNSSLQNSGISTHKFVTNIPSLTSATMPKNDITQNQANTLNLYSNFSANTAAQNTNNPNSFLKNAQTSNSGNIFPFQKANEEKPNPNAVSPFAQNNIANSNIFGSNNASMNFTSSSATSGFSFKPSGNTHHNDGIFTSTDLILFCDIDCMMDDEHSRTFEQAPSSSIYTSQFQNTIPQRNNTHNTHNTSTIAHTLNQPTSQNPFLQSSAQHQYSNTASSLFQPSQHSFTNTQNNTQPSQSSNQFNNHLKPNNAFNQSNPNANNNTTVFNSPSAPPFQFNNNAMSNGISGSIPYQGFNNNIGGNRIINQFSNNTHPSNSQPSSSWQQQVSIYILLFLFLYSF